MTKWLTHTNILNSLPYLKSLNTSSYFKFSPPEASTMLCKSDPSTSSPRICSFCRLFFLMPASSFQSPKLSKAVSLALLIFYTSSLQDLTGGLPSWSSGKESACQCREHKFDSWSGDAAEQLSPSAKTTEPVLSSLGATTGEVAAMRSLCTATGE